MDTFANPAPARLRYRKLAFVMAIVCFLLGLVFVFAPDVGDRTLTVGVCVAVGFVMLTIGRTGFWPPKTLRRP